MAKSKQPPVLTGQSLLKKVEELKHLSKEEKAKACGYSTITRNGQSRVNLMKFYNALMEADGTISLDNKGTGKGGRSASYKVSVQRNGNLLIGSAYTQQMGLKPGDELRIKLGRKHIHLHQIGADGEDDEEFDEN
ncbi:hypothetical protein Pse7367_2687 [Thalassoporum mexicanum PCC 7367]|uniref:AbrB family transcriptional regulator n=1 Tax=Thalassoporum mexicanum TaxID=3457544 RepID=UPI00029FA140|nr:AbrB family transcriptional regulator [Pseudanabaena sp. PCC 7367]AFY70942.1 hypothetical protein Pse7367_2687 [Pseudanabaena sp. PCC 7367]